MPQLLSTSHSVELPSAIAGAMNKSLAGDSSSTAQLDTLLAEQTLFLVLDNFEHLLALDGDAITGLIDHILQHLPGVTLLITSRERLRRWYSLMNVLVRMRSSHALQFESFSNVSQNR